MTESNVSSDGRLILQQTPLGCTIVGVSEDSAERARYVNLIQTLREDKSLNEKVNAFWRLEDCPSLHDNNKGMSFNDRRALEIIESSCRKRGNQ